MSALFDDPRSDIRVLLTVVGGIHKDEILNRAPFVFAGRGSLGYGQTALSAVADAGIPMDSLSDDDFPYRWAAPCAPFVAVVRNQDGDDIGYIFKF